MCEERLQPISLLLPDAHQPIAVLPMEHRLGQCQPTSNSSILWSCLSTACHGFASPHRGSYRLTAGSPNYPWRTRRACRGRRSTTSRLIRPIRRRGFRSPRLSSCPPRLFEPKRARRSSWLLQGQSEVFSLLLSLPWLSVAASGELEAFLVYQHCRFHVLF